MAIKLIKVTTTGGETIQFNAEHVTHLRPIDDGVSEITLVNGEKIQVNLRADDLAARITR